MTTMTKVRAVSDKLIVRLAEAPDKSPGGIVLPDQAKQRPTRGVVVAVGPGKATTQGTYMPLSIEEGDEIIFSRYGGSEIEIDDEKLYVLSSDDVLAIL